MGGAPSLASKQPSPTADRGKSPTSGAWCQRFLQKNLDLTRFIYVSHHTQDPICPMGHESPSALMPLYFNGVVKDSQGAFLMLL